MVWVLLLLYRLRGLRSRIGDQLIAWGIWFFCDHDKEINSAFFVAWLLLINWISVVRLTALSGKYCWFSLVILLGMAPVASCSGWAHVMSWALMGGIEQVFMGELLWWLWWWNCVRINVDMPMDVRINCVFWSDKNMMKKGGNLLVAPQEWWA